MAELSTTLKDAAYVTVGLGVLGLQKAQVRRVELTKQLAEQRKLVEQQIAGAGKLVEWQVGEAAKVAEEVLGAVRERLGMAPATGATA